MSDANSEARHDLTLTQAMCAPASRMVVVAATADTDAPGGPDATHEVRPGLALVARQATRFTRQLREGDHPAPGLCTAEQLDLRGWGYDHADPGRIDFDAVVSDGPHGLRGVRRLRRPRRGPPPRCVPVAGRRRDAPPGRHRRGGGRGPGRRRGRGRPAVSPQPDRKRCTKCGKTKPLGAFWRRTGERRESRCKACRRVEQAERRETEAFRAWQSAYLARSEVKARRRESGATWDREARRREWRLARAGTPRVKLPRRHCDLRHRLKGCADPGRRARMEAAIALCERELARIDAAAETRN